MAKNDSDTRIRNAKSLSKKLKSLPGDVQEQVLKTMTNGVQRVAKKADEDAPVGETGALGASITARNIDNDKFRWGIYANFYWLFVEFGTRQRKTKKGYNRGQMSPQPFFMSHWRKLKKTVTNSIKRNVKKKIKEKYAKR